MDGKRPVGRKRNITGSGRVEKRGEGLHTGPVGAGGRGDYQGGGGSGGGGPQRGPRRAGALKLTALLLLAAILVLGGKLGLGSLLGGGGGAPSTPSSNGSASTSANGSTSSGSMSSGLAGLLGAFSGGPSASAAWDRADNTRVLDTSVDSGARVKRVVPLGGGKDTVTLMVYMCGTDLESRSGMATADLQEMAAAELGENVNIIVCTGGCKAWKNSTVSSEVNQIYRVKSGGLELLEENAGSGPMTSPDTLSSFIRYCQKNYYADRSALIFWDHGGGSLTGYGYDEKNPRAGSMTLAGIDQALDDGDAVFDFIGFDACLMATVETALTLEPYADYLIASEETEPGVGWYYTDWLTELSKDTGMPTIEIGQKIADSFVEECARRCRGQKTTLSVIDLAETAATVPAALNAFAKTTTKLIETDGYQTVSDARGQTREFAQSSAIDQIDLVHLATKVATPEGEALARALLGAVKYNRTSSNMTNAYGLSAYFPLRKVSQVDSAVAAYERIGMDGDYARCIQAFAGMESAGQSAAGGASSPLPSLLGQLGSLGSSGGAGELSSLLGSLLSGGKSLDTEAMGAYLAENRFDPAALAWSEGPSPVIALSEEQWGLVQEIALNVFYDDGGGYIDLGLDNIFSFDENGALVGEYDGAWLAIEDQIVPYYYESTAADGENVTVTGRVPVLLNGERANLIIVFENGEPYVAGAARDYREGETETVAKNMTALEDGDTIDFVCDYYGYDGSYRDSYLLGDELTVSGELKVHDLLVEGGSCSAVYRFTDIYQQNYWTEPVP